MLRRWAYMAIAVVAAVLTTAEPVFSFHSDEGVIYTRSFEMDLKEFRVTQTLLNQTKVDLDDKESLPEQQVKDTMSVAGLYVFQKIMFWACIACIFLFYPTRVRWYMTLVIMGIVAVFYALVIIYALRISDMHYATLAPTWVTFMPAIVLAMMVFLNRNVARFGNYFDDIVEE